MVTRSNPPSLVPSGSVSDLSGLSRAASQLIRSASSSTLDEKPDEKNGIQKRGNSEVSQVEKRIRVMMWLSSCKPTPHFSTPVKGWHFSVFSRNVYFSLSAKRTLTFLSYEKNHTIHYCATYILLAPPTLFLHIVFAQYSLLRKVTCFVSHAQINATF